MGRAETVDTVLSLNFYVLTFEILSIIVTIIDQNGEKRNAVFKNRRLPAE